MLQSNKLLQISRIHIERAAADLPRGQEILARWPVADVVEVASHWRIPELRHCHPRQRSSSREGKQSSNGFTNVRYISYEKRGYLDTLLALARETIPYCLIRYAF